LRCHTKQLTKGLFMTKPGVKIRFERKPRTAELAAKPRWSCNENGCMEVLTVMVHIGGCLCSAAPQIDDAFKGNCRPPRVLAPMNKRRVHNDWDCSTAVSAVWGAPSMMSPQAWLQIQQKSKDDGGHAEHGVQDIHQSLRPRRWHTNCVRWSN
jgi:hypothetical protein